MASIWLDDQEDRRSAVLNDGHAIVWAGAGTGKTHTLTLRALYQLLRLGGKKLFDRDRQIRLEAAEQSIQSLVLVTFTRKAAAEMRTRIYRYLDRIAVCRDYEDLEVEARDDSLVLEVARAGIESDDEYESLRLAAEALEECAGHLQVSTLHSFAAAILRRHPIESGIPPGCRFAREDEDDLQEFQDQLIRRWLRTQAYRDTELYADLEVAARGFEFSQLPDWLGAASRHPWILGHLDALTVSGELESSSVWSALRVLGELLTALSGSKLRRVGGELLSLLEGSPEWGRIALFLQEQRGYLFESRGTRLAEAVASQEAPFRSILDDFPMLYSAALSRALQEKGESWPAFRRVVGRFVDWFQGAGVRELNMVGFDDMIQRAVRLLQNDPEVREQERRRIRALLVDEFQDTDPLQLELLRLLIEGRTGSTHAFSTFVVGDDKQSIYRFRGADVVSVGLFCRRLAETVEPVSRHYLRTSFRSSPEIVEFINSFFRQTVPLAEEVEQQLIPFHEASGRLPEWILMGGDRERLSAGQARDLAAQAVVNLVNEAVRGNPGEDPRNYGDFLVLVRTYRELDQLVPRLHRAGIPAVSSGARTFYRHLEVLDVLNLLIALHDPLDHLAVAAILRSPLVNLEDDLIHRLLVDPGAERIVFGDCPLPLDLPEVPGDRIERLRGLRRLRADLFVTDWLREVLDFIPYGIYVEPSDCEGRSVARIEKVIDSFGDEMLKGETPPLVWLLQQRARAGRTGWDEVHLGEDVALADESIDAVKVMTIHKAKGLEGKIVIVFNWNDLLTRTERGDRRGVPNVLRLIDEQGRAVKGFRLPWGDLIVESFDYRQALDLDREREREEARRLLYVAATRARDRLILLHPLTWNDGAESVVERVNGREGTPTVHLRRWAPGLDEPSIEGEEIWEVDETAYRELWSQRALEGCRPPVPLLRHPTDADEQLKSIGWEAADPFTTHTAAARRGTGEGPIAGALVHSYLEDCTLRAEYDPGLLKGLAASLGELKSRIGTPGTSPALVRASEILTRFFAGDILDDQGRSLIDRIQAGRVLARELPIFLNHEDGSWHGVIDLLLEEGSELVAVDYKTGTRTNPLPAQYIRQQEVYEAALRGLYPDRLVRFEFWWLQ